MKTSQIERAAVAAVAPPKFADVGCSRCLQKFGPGDSGFSMCSEHAAFDVVDTPVALHASPNTLYSTLHSNFMAADLRIGWVSEDWSDALQVSEIWSADCDLTMCLLPMVREAIETEAHAERNTAGWDWS